ncbi:MAG: hypothetical protein AB8G95_14815 [Anaerolineae bacterium]
MKNFRILEINGGTVTESDSIRLEIPADLSAYTNAQIDDYGGRKRRDYLWQQTSGAELTLQARFSHPADQLSGTAGFGFWNAPFGDPTTPWPTLPQATWFFAAAPPSDLPLNPKGAGQGFFASTLDATTMRAIALAPLAPPVVLLNHIPAFRRTVWPKVQQRLGMSYTQIDQIDITDWHTYRLVWNAFGSQFYIDDKLLSSVPHSPRGPLGFVCWIDNQFMRLTPTGRMSAGAIMTPYTQWLEINDLSLKPNLTAPKKQQS